MLENTNAVATVGVKDISKARAFYEGTLVLTPVESGESGVMTFRSGASRVLVYQSQYAGTNEATAITWTLDGGLEDTVQALKAKGVTFEHYDFPGMTRQGDVHLTGESKAAWFKDPDGNILALVGR